ncbi:MAG: hypothetical protein QXO25_06115 [Candidatus Bathyarchaeia archaeon]
MPSISKLKVDLTVTERLRYRLRKSLIDEDEEGPTYEKRIYFRNINSGEEIRDTRKTVGGNHGLFRRTRNQVASTHLDCASGPEST